MLTRVVRRQELPRLAEVCGIESDVDVEVSFRIDDHGRVHVTAELSATVNLDCYLCNEMVTWRLQTAFDAVVAFDEIQAGEWSELTGANGGQMEQIIVVSGQTLDVAELIEDELILGLPLQARCEQGCAETPEMRYDDGHSEAAQVALSDRQMPFAGLRELIAESDFAPNDRDKGSN